MVINANKSTENGIIEIIVTQTPTFITLIVKDSGIGLSEDQRHLFIDALSSHSTNNYKIFETLGLDLVIVKELVTLHNGELFLESDQKSGTIFTINLPQSDTISSVETNTPHEQPITNQEQFTQNYF